MDYAEESLELDWPAALKALSDHELAESSAESQPRLLAGRVLPFELPPSFGNRPFKLPLGFHPPVGNRRRRPARHLSRERQGHFPGQLCDSRPSTRRRGRVKVLRKQGTATIVVASGQTYITDTRLCACPTDTKAIEALRCRRQLDERLRRREPTRGKRRSPLELPPSC